MGKEYQLPAYMLGSVPIAGPVIFTDDFEGTMGWLVSGTGSGEAVTADTTYFFQGSKSMLLRPRVTGASADDEALAYKYFSATPAKFLNLSFWFAVLNWAEIKYFEASFQWDDGQLIYTIGARYTQATPSWSIGDAAGSYAVVPGLGYDHSPLCWTKFRMTADIQNGKLGTLSIGSRTADISAYTIPTVATSGAIVGCLGIGTTNAGSGCPRTYVDQLVLTETK